MNSILLNICFFLLWLIGLNNQKCLIDYYNIGQTLVFNRMNYKLSYSEHPNDSYYKQEYLPNASTLENYNDMITIDVLNRDISLNTAVQLQLNKLVERKKNDPICNYQLLENKEKNEFILDFIVSENAKSSIIEWNAYDYKVYFDKAGHKGILLFCLSHRAYNGESNTFLKSLGTYRDEMLKKVTNYKIPEIRLLN